MRANTVWPAAARASALACVVESAILAASVVIARLYVYVEISGLCLMLALDTGCYLGTRSAWPPERRDRPDGRRKPGQPHGCARCSSVQRTLAEVFSLADPSPAQLEEDPMSEADSDITLKELLKSPFGSLVP